MKQMKKKISVNFEHFLNGVTVKAVVVVENTCMYIFGVIYVKN